MRKTSRIYLCASPAGHVWLFEVVWLNLGEYAVCCIYEFSAGATFEVVWLILRGAAGYAVVGFLKIIKVFWPCLKFFTYLAFNMLSSKGT